MRGNVRFWRRISDSADDGFSLVEGVVAALILAILAGAVAALLVDQLKTTRNARQRAAAADLAAREMQITRNTFESSTAGEQAIATSGAVVNPDPLNTALPAGQASSTSVLNGVPYTVKRSVQWNLVGNGASACDGGSLISYPSLEVQVAVTWPNMGDTQPVVNDTVLTPLKNDINTSSYGYLAVKVLDRDGNPVSGVGVSAVGPGGTSTVTTDNSGCAVAQVSQSGTYTATLSDPGYVDTTGNATPSKSTTVTVATLQRLQMTYDKAWTVAVTEKTADGYSLPSPLPAITVQNSGITGAKPSPQNNNTSYPASGTTTSLTLYPFSDGYKTWAGGCVDAEPAATGGTDPVIGPAAPGASLTATVVLGALDVTVTHQDGTPASGVTVTAVSNSSSTCAPDTSPLTVGQTDANGHIAGSLPYGAWNLTANGVTTTVGIGASDPSDAAAITVP